jgi:hypothetical protein
MQEENAKNKDSFFRDAGELSFGLQFPGSTDAILWEIVTPWANRKSP